MPSSLMLLCPKSTNSKIVFVWNVLPKALAPSTSILFENKFKVFKDLLLSNARAKLYAPDTPILFVLMSNTSIFNKIKLGILILKSVIFFYI